MTQAKSLYKVTPGARYLWPLFARATILVCAIVGLWSCSPTNAGYIEISPAAASPGMAEDNSHTSPLVDSEAAADCYLDSEERLTVFVGRHNVFACASGETLPTTTLFACGCMDSNYLRSELADFAFLVPDEKCLAFVYGSGRERNLHMENAATALGYQFVHVDAASACVLLGMRQPVLTDEGIPPFCPGECDKPNRGLSPPLRSGWETRLSSVAGDISENIDADEVVARVRQSLAGVKHCYESQLQNNPFLQGTVTVAFTIAPSGDVGSCAITENTVPSAVVADCIRRRVQRWRMVSPREGTATVSYSFVFTTAKKPPGHKEIKSELNAKRRATCKAMGR